MDALMAHVFESVVAWAVPAAAGALAGWAARAVHASRERRRLEERRDAALVDGVVEGRPLSREYAEYLRRAYESYRGLGGNDVGETMYRQITEHGVS